MQSRVAHEYGLAYSIRLDIPQPQRGEAVQHARRRFPRMSGAHIDAVAVRPDRSSSSRLWLRRTHAICQDHITDFTGRLMLPRSLVTAGSRAKRRLIGEEMLAQWVDFWKERRCALTLDPRFGFGVAATSDVRCGTRLLGGQLDEGLEDDDRLVEPCGSMFGPASLVNAACAACANVSLGRTPGGRVCSAKVSRTLREGDAICAHYFPNGVDSPLCAVCEGKLSE